MILAADYPLLEILATMAFFFLWMCWIWTLVIVLTDVFGRSTFSGGKKALWSVFVIFLPFLGVICYLAAHGDDMGERSSLGTRRGSAGAPSAADEIAGAKRLLDSGAISDAEYVQLKQRALAG